LTGARIRADRLFQCAYSGVVWISQIDIAQPLEYAVRLVERCGRRVANQHRQDAFFQVLRLDREGKMSWTPSLAAEEYDDGTCACYVFRFNFFPSFSYRTE
jgi:hypothetical protein